MSKNITLRNVRPGDFVCDAHDRIDLSLLPEGSRITDKISIPFTDGTKVIEKMVEEALRMDMSPQESWKPGPEYCYQYTNKHLVVVGETCEGLTLAMSWDGVIITFLNVCVPTE